MISLSDIIKAAVPFVSEQLNDNYDKYIIEQEIRWRPEPSHKVEGDVMPEILSAWSVSQDKLILIACVHHDFLTYAFEFGSIAEMEEALKGDRFYLNPFCTYVIPVIKGAVKGFHMLDSNGKTIIKEKVVDSPMDDPFQYTIKWYNV